MRQILIREIFKLKMIEVKIFYLPFASSDAVIKNTSLSHDFFWLILIISYCNKDKITLGNWNYSWKNARLFLLNKFTYKYEQWTKHEISTPMINLIKAHSFLNQSSVRTAFRLFKSLGTSSRRRSLFDQHFWPFDWYQCLFIPICIVSIFCDSGLFNY